MFMLKKFFFKKISQIMTVVNSNKGTKYEKATNFNLKQFYFIQNDKVLLNDREHQNKLIYELLQKLFS